MKRFIKNLIKQCIGRDRLDYTRIQRFDRFNRQHITNGPFRLGTKGVSRVLVKRYDFFIVGSDQVWNTGFTNVRNKLSHLLLSFAPDEKRVAYAASFGRFDIDKDYRHCFEKELSRFKAISVREKAGVSMVEQCGASAEVVLDPTMLLPCDQWEEIAVKPVFLPCGEYIVTYFLGGMDDRVKDYTRSVAGGRNIVKLYDVYTPKEQIEDGEAYCAAPDEFLWIIAHASCVLTDSFHGAVFSILYHKPFIVFERLNTSEGGQMGSRIDTLLNTFQLEECRGDIHNPAIDPKDQDWKKVEVLLEQKRRQSLAFLKNALEI